MVVGIHLGQAAIGALFQSAGGTRLPRQRLPLLFPWVLRCTLANDPASAPWGGLPKPVALVARLTCDCIQHVFGQWAAALGTEFFPLEAPAWTHKDAAWFEKSNDHWEEVFQADRIELLVEEMRVLIDLLERKTGRRFSEAKLTALMEKINEQEGYIAEAAQIDRRGAAVSGVDRRSNAEYHDPSVASRLRLGRRARQALSRRGRRAGQGGSVCQQQ